MKKTQIFVYFVFQYLPKTHSPLMWRYLNCLSIRSLWNLPVKIFLKCIYFSQVDEKSSTAHLTVSTKLFSIVSFWYNSVETFFKFTYFSWADKKSSSTQLAISTNLSFDRITLKSSYYNIFIRIFCNRILS